MSHCCHFYCSNFSINRNIKYLNKAMFTIKFHKLHIGYIYTRVSQKTRIAKLTRQSEYHTSPLLRHLANCTKHNVVFDSAPLAPLYESTTLYRKPQTHVFL